MISKKKKRKKKSRYKRLDYFSIKANKTLKSRSGWEYAYFQYLDKNQDVKSYEYESLKIPYLSNKKSGKIRNYIPDFLITFTNDSKLIVEIKPKRFLDKLQVKKKINAAKEYAEKNGIQFIVLTEDSLKLLNVI
jgi:hypothetical protein